MKRPKLLIIIRLFLSPGDVVGEPGWLQVLQDQGAVRKSDSDCGQVCQSPRSNGNMRNHVQTRGELRLGSYVVV